MIILFKKLIPTLMEFRPVFHKPSFVVIMLKNRVENEIELSLIPLEENMCSNNRPSQTLVVIFNFGKEKGKER